MSPSEVREVRSLTLETVCCPMTEHLWAKCHDGMIDLFILCRKCGRTPLEALAQLPIHP